MSYNIGKKPTWSSFQHDVIGALQGMENYEFGWRDFGNETAGVSVRPRGGLSETLNFTIAQGPHTPWGSSIELPSASGWSRNIGAQIWVDDDMKPHFKTPTDALKGFIKASYTTTARTGPEGRFSYVLQEGFAEQQLVGKTMMYSHDVHNQRAREDYAERIGVRIPREGSQVDAYTGIYNLAKGASDTDPLRHIRGMAPWKGSDDVTRLRRMGTTAPWREGEGWDWQTEIFGKTAMKALKQGNIAFEGGLREQADLLRPKEGGGLEVAQPEYIRKMSDAGYRWLNMLFPGETERRAVGVQRGIFHTPGSPFSGGMVSYENQMKGIYSGAYPSQLQHTVKIPHIRDMAGSQFKAQFGIFTQNAEGVYKRTGPTKGHVIEAGESATVGMISYRGPDKETVTTPIVQHATRQITLTGDPKLYMPTGFTETTGKAHSGVMPGGRPLPDDYRDLTTPGFKDPGAAEPSLAKNLYQQELVDIIKDKFPGEVEFGTKYQYPTIQMPYHTETGTAWKGSGLKAVEIVMAGLGTEGGTIPTKDRQVAIGAGSAVIKGLTAELKNPLDAFTHEFGALTQEKQAQMLEELGGHTGKVLSAYARQPGEMGKPGAVSMDVLAQKYSDLSGEQTSPWGFMNILHKQIERLSADRPGYTLGKYGRGYAMEPQMVTLGYVRPDEMKFLKKEFYRGAQLERGDAPPRTGRESVELMKKNMAFNYDPDTGNYEWRIRQPGLYATMVSNITAEHMWKQPRLAFEEQAAIAYRYPEIAKHLGIGEDVQAGGGRAFTPRHVEAWKEVSDVYQYTKENLRRGQGGATLTDESGGLVAPPAGERTTFNAEQMGELEMKLLDLGEGRPYEEYEEAVTSTVKGKGPLYSATSGAMLERPKTMGAVTETELDEFGKEVPLSRMGKNYFEGLLDFTRGGIAEKGSSKAMATLQRERQLADESSARTVPKSVAGAYLRESRGGRYVGAFGQGLQNMITSQSNMDRMLKDLRRGSHVQPKGAEGKAAWLEGARADVGRWGGLPGLFFRSPNLGREGSAVPVNFVTPQMIRKQTGLEMGRGSYIDEAGQAHAGSLPLTGYTGGVGAPVRELFGDFDADPNITVGLARATKGGLAQIPLGALKGDLSRGTKEYLQQSDELLRTMAGEERGVPAGELDIFADQFKGMIKYSTSENIQEWVKERGEGLTQAPTEDIFEAGTKVLDSQMLMGQAYNVRRRVESAASALGMSKRAIARGHTGAVLPYQTALDKQRFGQSNLERLMSTFTLQVKGGDPTFMYRTAEGKFTSMPERNFGQTLAGLIGQDKPLPAHGAGLFAMNDQQFGQIEKSMAGGASMSQAVYGGGGFEGIADADYDISQTPIGLGLHSKAAGALLGLHGKQQVFKFGDLKGQTALPHMGGMMMPGGGMLGRGPMTVKDWVQNSLVQETAAMYKTLTNRGTPSVSERAIMEQARLEGRGGAPATLAAQKYSSQAAYAAMVTADAHVAAQGAHLANISPEAAKQAAALGAEYPPGDFRNAEYNETAEDVTERIRTGRGGPLHDNFVLAKGERGEFMLQRTSKVGVPLEGEGVQDFFGGGGSTFGGRPKRPESESFRIMNKGIEAMRMADARSKYVPATQSASGRWTPSGEEGFKGVGKRIMGALGEATGRTERELLGEYEELGGLGYTIGRLSPDQLNAIGAQFTGAGAKALKLQTAITAGAGAAKDIGAPGPMMSFAAAKDKLSPIERDISIAAGLESAYKMEGGKGSLMGRLQATATESSVKGVDKALNEFEQSLKKINTTTGELHELTKKERASVIDSQRKGIQLSRAIRAQYMPALKEAIATRRMPGVGGQPGEVATNAQMLEMQEKLAGMYRGEATDVKRLQALDESQRPVSGQQLSRFTRKLIGGWGLFYLGHLASFPMKSWQYGYAEREQSQGAMAQAAGQYLGGEAAFPTTDFATQRSKVAAGGRVAGLMARGGAGLPPSARDIGGAAMAGVSGYAMSLFVSQAASGVAPGLAAGLATAAPWIGAIGVAGGLIAAQAAYAEYPEATMSNLITSRGPMDSWWGGVKDTWTWGFEGMFVGKEAKTQAKNYAEYMEQLKRGEDISRMPSLEGTIEQGRERLTLTSSNGWVRDEDLAYIPPENIMMEEDGTTPRTREVGRAGDFEFTEHKLMTTKEWQRMAAGFPREYPELDPDIASQAFLRLAPAGLGGPEIERSIRAQMQGVPSPALVQGAMGAFRIEPSLREGARLEMQYASMDMFDAMKQQTGQALAQQLSPTFIAAYEKAFRQRPGEITTLAHDLTDPERLRIRQGQPDIERDMAAELDTWSRSQHLGLLYAESDFQQRAYESAIIREDKEYDPKYMSPEERQAAMADQKATDMAFQYQEQAGFYGADRQKMFDYAMGGTQQRALAGRISGMMPKAAEFGLDIQKFTDDLTSGVTSAVVAGMALGVAEAAPSVGWDSTAAYNFASQGFQEATIGQLATANAQSVLATTGNQAGADAMRIRSMSSTDAARWNQRLLNRDPTAITLTALGRMPGQAPGSALEAQQYVSQAVSMGGEPTGRPWGSISLHTGDMVAALGGDQAVIDAGGDPAALRFRQQEFAGERILGTRLAGTEVGIAMKHGLQDTFAGLPVPEQLRGIGGTTAANWARGQYQYQSQMASLGAQMAQLNLSYAFQTGIGLDQYSTTDPRSGAPLIHGAGAGGFWGIQDKQMGLQKKQAEWNFQFQREGIELQSQQFFENFNINQRQSQMQRGWTTSDWNFQDRMRGMQWDWQIEDFQEESRFMTGRERKKAETGMERATTMHDEEGKRIDENRQRQKEMWKLEDERFALQKKHFLEQKKRQEESLKMQEKFWKENFKLQKEQQDLQRAYFLEQQEIQKSAIGAQMYYAEKMKEVSDALFLTGEAFHELQEQWEIAGDYYTAFVQGVVGGSNVLIKLGNVWWERIQSGETYSPDYDFFHWPESKNPNRGKQGKGDEKPRQEQTIDLGEDTGGDSTSGTESFTPLTTWGGVSGSSSINLPKEGGSMTVVVQVGNKEFENYIVDVIKKAI